MAMAFSFTRDTNDTRGFDEVLATAFPFRDCGSWVWGRLPWGQMWVKWAGTGAEKLFPADVILGLSIRDQIRTKPTVFHSAFFTQSLPQSLYRFYQSWLCIGISHL
ncbi:hypothetical protein BDBG_16284 [Blastomyces gilchristii SLH14081]|uniref:Uncharacterized protein n=1 Tax=Blastomyces gilchristii (strain SLH14081) TaxID=559298 RepID=A0A179UBN4_BLAGS|nr:uncharacterized protein BDBG_16284 [Blastomyces gilchristii SLH14081]OAT04567.1 hypothetical protein BDBG_16284 [Blastomyces gilchristii SLH14081]